MKHLKKYLLPIWSVLIVTVGFLIGTQFAKPKTTVKINKPKARKNGILNLSPEIKQERQIKKQTRKQRRKQKRAGKKK